MAKDLRAAFLGVPSQARSVLLAGAGRRFCVGGDVRAFGSAPDPGAFVGGLAGEWHQAIHAISDIGIPVVAAVHGAAAGAGVGLMLACDLVVCARSTVIRPGYIGLGFSPDGGTSWALTRLLGLPRAMELMLTNGEMTASDALEAGMVVRVADDDHLDDHALALARQLAEGPVRAIARTRRLARGALTNTLSEHLDEEARLIALSADDVEGREGVQAFLGRRSPDFTKT
jgi:2-(1,2-epoxy-1,2-dihydrophenyl)acetyl-CoA isomerase